MSKQFLDWLSPKMTPSTTAQELIEYNKGWFDAEFSNSTHLMRGIGPYCDAWNAYMRLNRDPKTN